MLDMDSIQEPARAHHAEGTTKIDWLHNDQHTGINDRLNHFKGGGGGKKVARSIAEDATQLKITADILAADGNEHLDEVKRALNTDQPDSDKFQLSNGKTS